MQEGDTELGGLQIPHGNNINPPTPTPGPQPVTSATPQNPQPVPQSSPQPTPQLSTPQSINQPVNQPVDQLFSQTFSPENHTTNQSVIGSQTPQPQTFEQQFQSQVQTSAQPTPDTDIMLHNNSKKKRTLIVLGFLLLAIAIIGIIVVYFVFQQNNEKEKNIADTQILLNRYSNYLLYGVDSDTMIGNDTVWSDDKIKEKVGADEMSRAEYFNNLLALYSGFSEQLDGAAYLTGLSVADVELLGGLVGNNTGALESLQLYAVTPNLSMENMIALYFEQGGDSMVNYVESVYADFVGSNNQKNHDYGVSKMGLASNIRNLYNEYSDLGCIEGQTLINSCVDNNNAENEVISGNLAILREYITILDDAEWHMSNDVVGLSKMIYDFFHDMEDGDGI